MAKKTPKAPAPSPRPSRWAALRPTKSVRAAASTAGVLGAMGLGAYIGLQSYSGEPWFVEAGVGAGVVLVATLLIPLALGLLRLLWALLRTTHGALGVAALLAVFLLRVQFTSASVAALEALAVVTLPALALGGLTAFLGGSASTWGRVLGAATALVAIGALGGGYWWLTQGRGTTDHLVAQTPREESALPTPSTADDPSALGGWTVGTLTYGSGADKHRAEFGDDVGIVTTSVNGRPFAKGPSGSGFKNWFGQKGKLRRKFWGFGLDALPRNGRVWYPVEGEGPFPLALIVHGNHSMGDFSDGGYGYLGELLASRGIIAVSVDENFLNGSFVGGSLRKENDLRAWLLLEHLAMWREWNQDPTPLPAGPKASQLSFYGRVDLDRVALIGHSRGGEAVAVAALFNTLSRYPDDATVPFDYDFGIQAVAAIAPVDGQYRPADRRAPLRDVNYFTIHGAHDGDVTSFDGDRIFDRLEFSDPGSDQFKSSLYLYRANHGQFNTTWGDSDRSAPASYFLNRAALMSGDDQRQVAKVFLSAFLAATVQRQDEYRSLFRDPAVGREWLPQPSPLLVSRYEHSSFAPLANFEEDVDVTTGSIPGVTLATEGLTRWREGDIELRTSRRGDNGVWLGWSDDPDDQPNPHGRRDPRALEANAGKAAGEPVEAVAQRGPAAPSFTVYLDEQARVALGDGNGFLQLDIAVADEDPDAHDYAPSDDNGNVNNDNDNSSNDSGNDNDDSSGEESDANDPPMDLSLVFEDTQGRTVSLAVREFGEIPPVLETQITRETPVQGGKTSSEPNLQTILVPLVQLAERGQLDPTQLASICLRFDVAPKGVVIVDRIGITR